MVSVLTRVSDNRGEGSVPRRRGHGARAGVHSQGAPEHLCPLSVPRGLRGRAAQAQSHPVGQECSVDTRPDQGPPASYLGNDLRSGQRCRDPVRLPAPHPAPRSPARVSACAHFHGGRWAPWASKGAWLDSHIGDGSFIVTCSERTASPFHRWGD